MSKKKISKNRHEPSSKHVGGQASPPQGGFHALRETIESIVIAFGLAFLFRTFAAEAFVIPTGSMSPALQGQHKDVHCSECGYRFFTTASSEGEDRDNMIARLRRPGLSLEERERLRRNIAGLEVLAGVCPMCRQTMAFRTDLPPVVDEFVNLDGVQDQPSYPGDRILVNKFSYSREDPQRWDVVVFKFPGDGTMNYIKRLVGLPQETLRIYQGDLFARPAEKGADFHILRKPPEKIRAMLQPVHDTQHESSRLFRAGWPLRWKATTPDGWQVEAQPDDRAVLQKFKFESSNADSNDEPVAWLRYRHLLPDNQDWVRARTFDKTGKYRGQSKQQWLSKVRPRLIRDFNSYNARKLRGQLPRAGWRIPQRMLGMEWVGDLAVQCDVEVRQARGELLLDLVEAGKHFTCRIDLQTGRATLGIDGFDDFHPSANTPVSAPGAYQLLFANVDDQLLLWIDGDLIDMGDGTYDPDRLFGDRSQMIPRTSDEDAGDLAPVGVGARGASLTVTRLQVKRDIYYVATKWTDNQNYTDYTLPQLSALLPNGTRLPPLENVQQLFIDPDAWPRFLTRQKRDFELDEDQFFVMGDNSPESQDCRLWKNSPVYKGVPGGPYLDRRLLTGKAVCVFWPHSWGGIPGLKKLPGFPNFGDMRLVR